ncbi:MAG: acyltransferase [Paludisphaera borealis]|uniref:acyltransferase family protein n=1 Tax=Paludisphaera borealis TaxID=1387353 RepID=UPI00284C642D|nr:acyltransferase [Paludisphaera borealis]MDR3621670.1 acyltransferase [Paludisphaera borealis]
MKTHFVPDARPGSTSTSRPRLTAISGLRLVACLHIYIFHIMQAHRAGLMTFEILDRLPTPAARILSQGFISTGVFFQLSGFLLAYAYLRPDGRPKVSDRAFWVGRVFRLYPLYLLSLILLAPAPALLPITAKPTTPGDMAAMVATNLTLLQSWFPSYAIAWNAPAWALSAFVPLYLVFPGFSRWIAGFEAPALHRMLGVLVAASIAPACAYMIVDPYGDAWNATAITLGGFWLNVLRFDPLVWLPQFLAGVVLGRLVVLRTNEPAAGPKSGMARGDLAAAAILGILAFGPVPYVLLRHGLLAPLTLVVLADLAAGKGFLSRLLSGSWQDRLADAGFGLFALQMPVGLGFALAVFRGSTGTTGQLAALVLVTLAAALAWSEFVQRPLLRRLRKRSTPAIGNEPASRERPFATTAAVD